MSIHGRLRCFVLDDEIDIYPRIQIREALELNHDVTIARSCSEAIERYPEGAPYDLLCLDHDMEGNYEYRPEYPNTGYQFVKWLVEVSGEIDELSGMQDIRVILHSHNPVGRRRMRDLLEAADAFDISECPFGPAYIKQLKEQLG